MHEIPHIGRTNVHFQWNWAEEEGLFEENTMGGKVDKDIPCYYIGGEVQVRGMV